MEDPHESCFPVRIFIVVLLFFVSLAEAQTNPRARDLGVPFDGTTGSLNAITDVKGVEVGDTTLMSGEGPLKAGVGPIRTGVTAVLPCGKDSTDPVFAGWFTQNGNGEMTGTTWVEESGFLEGPIMITNTHSVGVVRDAVIAWRLRHGPPNEDGYAWSLPVVAETWDGYLNDINGFHVKPEDVFHALDSAHGGAVEEGNVGGGTGMICNEFKGGIGSSSRVLDAKYGGYTVGVLVQCNYGQRDQLRIAGVPVGREISGEKVWDDDVGSVIVVVATDAPLIPTQLVSDQRTPSCVWLHEIAILWNERARKEGVDEVAAAGFGAGAERAECGGVLPRAWGMCSAILRLEKAAEPARGGPVRGSETGGSLAGVDRVARRGD